MLFRSVVNIEQGEIVFKFYEKKENEYNSKGYDELDVLFRTNKKSEFNSFKRSGTFIEISMNKLRVFVFSIYVSGTFSEYTIFFK